MLAASILRKFYQKTTKENAKIKTSQLVFADKLNALKAHSQVSDNIWQMKSL